MTCYIALQFVVPTDGVKLMKHKVTPLVCSSSMSMDEANFVLRAKRVKVKDTGVVLAKGPPMLKLDNLSLGFYNICCSMMCE